MTPVFQLVAEFFKARLSGLTEANGYSFTVLPDHLYVDGQAPTQQIGRHAVVEIWDDQGELSRQAGDRSSIASYQVEIRIEAPTRPETYKRQAREMMGDVARVCSVATFDTDVPQGVASIYCSGWARELYEGNALRLRIDFTVKAHSIG